MMAFNDVCKTVHLGELSCELRKELRHCGVVAQLHQPEEELESLTSQPLPLGLASDL